MTNKDLKDGILPDEWLIDRNQELTALKNRIPILKGTTKKWKDIIAFVAHKGEVHLSDILSAFDIKPNSLRSQLRYYVNKGILERTSVGCFRLNSTPPQSTTKKEPNIDPYIKCPFCGENDFDLCGLKTHFERGHCTTYNELEEYK